ncbi:MAG: hypothetical protein AB8B96_09530 [Lysobacterales bacterium]
MLKLLSATLALVMIALFPSTGAAQSGPGEYIIENDAPEATSSGSWTRSNLPSSYNTSSLWAVVGGAVDRFRFTPSLAAAGNYEVYAWNSCYSNRATNVRHIVTHSAGSTTIEVDQDCDTGSFGEWFSLGTFAFDAGSAGHLEITDDGIVPPATTYMGADAARWLLRDVVNAPVITPSDTTLSLIEGDVAALSATAQDIEDGDLTTAISWQVDTVADTAVGATFNFTPPLGDSVVTLSATDSEGNEGSTTIAISVLPDPNNMPPQEEYIIDNTDSGASAEGTWNSTSLPSQFGSSSLWATVGGATERFRFTPALEVNGNYEVFAWNSCFSNRATNVRHIFACRTGLTPLQETRPPFSRCTAVFTNQAI